MHSDVKKNKIKNNYKNTQKMILELGGLIKKNKENTHWKEILK